MYYNTRKMTNAHSKLAKDQTDFSNGKIYVIISPNCDLFYYGSTAYTIEKRFSLHKTPSSTCTSKKILDAGDAEIFEIESYPCSCKEELEDREAFYIVNDWEGCVNKIIPGAVRRAGGLKVYNKIRNATPKAKSNKKTYESKPEVKEHRAEKIICNICGCMTSRGNKAQHQKTKKCQKFLNDE
jgi:hypothetical protein